MGTYANSADPVQKLSLAASNQGLHCLLVQTFLQNTIKVKTTTRNFLSIVPPKEGV